MVRKSTLWLALGLVAASSNGVTPAHASVAEPVAQWVTLGTSGGPNVLADRSQIANALVVDGVVYLFDVGNGVRRQLARANLPETNIRAIFLSHHHVDHNADVGPVLFAHYLGSPEKLRVIGPEGTETLVRGLVAANAPTVLASYQPTGKLRGPLADSVEATDLAAKLDEPTVIYQDDRIKVEAISVSHFQLPPQQPLPRMPQAVAFRVTAGGRTFVYTGDTGKTGALVKIAKGADVFITEVVEPNAIAQAIATRPGVDPDARQGIVNSITTNHLPPDYIGKIAAEAGVKEVVLTHFVPAPEGAADTSSYIRGIRQSYSGPVSLANDLSRY